MSDMCGCEKCVDERIDLMRALGDEEHMLFRGPNILGWSYGCGKCGNKRCPHHTDHLLECTRSNAPGQPGSSYTLTLDRDILVHPYTPCEARVAAFLSEKGIGGGNDPIGFLMASHDYAIAERNALRAEKTKDDQ